MCLPQRVSCFPESLKKGFIAPSTAWRQALTIFFITEDETMDNRERRTSSWAFHLRAEWTAKEPVLWAGQAYGLQHNLVHQNDKVSHSLSQYLWGFSCHPQGRGPLSALPPAQDHSNEKDFWSKIQLIELEQPSAYFVWWSPPFSRCIYRRWSSQTERKTPLFPNKLLMVFARLSSEMEFCPICIGKWVSYLFWTYLHISMLPAYLKTRNTGLRFRRPTIVLILSLATYRMLDISLKLFGCQV
jgi:hypothetical protein